MISECITAKIIYLDLLKTKINSPDYPPRLSNEYLARLKHTI